jgi:hypothetical protein
MDPYLEGDLWQDVHERLANQISTQVMPLLAPKYVALLARRYVLDRSGIGIYEPGPPSRVVYPDMHVLHTTDGPANSPPTGPALTPPAVEVASPAPVPHLSVEIRAVADHHLVTSKQDRRGRARIQ